MATNGLKNDQEDNFDVDAKSGKNKESLKAQINSVIIKIKCDTCDKAFSQPQHVTSHKNRVHLNLKIPCDRCGQSFGSNQALKNHQITNHNMTAGLTELKCEQCDFVDVSSYKSILRQQESGRRCESFTLG